jgi:cell division protein FtsL
MMNARISMLVLAMAVLLSSFFVINAKHQNRKAFVELQTLKNQQYQMETEWGQLQLEQAAWAAHGRVEKIASTELGMILPSMKSVSIIKP